MLRQAIILAVAVTVALATAKGLVSYVDSRAIARPTPSSDSTETTTVAARTGELRKSSDGHYWARAEINGQSILCLVDTGATAVALTEADAASVGLKPAKLNYDVAVVTAGGRTRAAKVELAQVSVDGVRIDHVKAMVVEDGLSSSLLGMSYLGRLSRFAATPTTLVLQS